MRRNALILVALAGCAAPARERSAPPAPAPVPPPVAPAPVAPAPVAPAAPTPPEADVTGFESVTSSAGTYVVHYRALPAGWERGKLLDVELWVAPAAHPRQRLTDVALALDAEMPEHQHGMSVVPTVARRDDGSFRVSGVRLHMPGWWQVHFDVTRGPWTERAEVRVELE